MAAVRLVELDDVDAVTAMVASAFAADPAWVFMMGQGNDEGMRAFARALLLPRIRRGTAWCTADCTAVAMWDRYGEDFTRDNEYDARWAAFRQQAGDAVFDRVAAYEDAVGAAQPSAPYWYLGVLATSPAAQGQGLATAVLEPAFEAAAADGWDCWLETSTPGNKAFYERRGFGGAIPVDVPGGPQTWWLRRTTKKGSTNAVSR